MEESKELSHTGRGAGNRNRRLAAMQHLQQLGHHFSDQAMRERSPLLYHEHVGQFLGQGNAPEAAAVANADAGSAGGGPGAAMRLSDALMAQHEALLTHRKLQQEMQEDEAHKEFSEEEEDEEGEEEEEEQGQEGVQGPGSSLHGQHGAASQRSQPSIHGQHGAAHQGSHHGQQPGTLSREALARKRRELLKEMENRFLQGLDPGIDYDAIDADTRLDEHWAAQITQDAEDAYFQEQDGDSESNREERKEEYDY